MPRSIIVLSLLAFLCYNGLAEAQTNSSSIESKNSNNDIEFDTEPLQTGSGSGKLPYTDDEDLLSSGSGSGSGQKQVEPVDAFTPVTSTSTTPKVIVTVETTVATSQPVSKCQKERKAALQIGEANAPRCSGADYAAVQCQDDNCWCSDYNGKPVPSTWMEAPNKPDCDHGINLPPCIFLLVKSRRSKLLGMSLPKCTTDGQYQRIQCHELSCYCVEQDTGLAVEGTMVVKPSKPVCEATTFPTTTHKLLSKCEREREGALGDKAVDAPRCFKGEYESMQCQGDQCWCSDFGGKPVHGTRMDSPNTPDCESGINLPPCTFHLVKSMRSKMLGTFVPKCTMEGRFDRMQCHGSTCYCVEEDTGKTVDNTLVVKPSTPSCDGNINLDGSDIDSGPEDKEDVNTTEENINSVDDDDDGDDDNDRSEEESNKTDQLPDEKILSEGRHSHNTKVETVSAIMVQPGLLAGIIGGSVVLVLCLVLLIMFIVYRMRKKDEGSYPLDEPRKPKYPYVRAPEREFYA